MKERFNNQYTSVDRRNDEKQAFINRFNTISKARRREIEAIAPATASYCAMTPEENLYWVCYRIRNKLRLRPTNVPHVF